MLGRQMIPMPRHGTVNEAKAWAQNNNLLWFVWRDRILSTSQQAWTEVCIHGDPITRACPDCPLDLGRVDQAAV